MYMTQSKIIDHTLFQGYLDNLGTTIVEKMIAMYIEQSVIYLNDIAAATSEEHQQEWQSRCHKMKGAAGSVGMIEVHATLVAIEKSIARSSEKEKFVKELNSLNEQAIKAFKQRLATA